VRADASIVVRAPHARRGAIKLRGALDAFGVAVHDRVALDVGAASGGFTEVLLSAGARRVYAVDAGHGQLAGRLRQDRRVVNLEHTNLARLDRTLVPETVDVITVDLSYLALADAVPQLKSVAIAPGADLVVLVKPMFELHAAALPAPDAVGRAVVAVERSLRDGQWRVCGAVESPVRGRNGAIEWFVHAQREL
jgi:23S rRNA (cytidine1920-2'-O)/16S rRNA (cytidine1409-2'-O)-methyltransferase